MFKVHRSIECLVSHASCGPDGDTLVFSDCKGNSVLVATDEQEVTLLGCQIVKHLLDRIEDDPLHYRESQHLDAINVVKQLSIRLTEVLKMVTAE